MEEFNPSSFYDFIKPDWLTPDIIGELTRRCESFTFKQKEIISADWLPGSAYFIFSGLVMCYAKKGDRNIVKWIRGKRDFTFDENLFNPDIFHNMEHNVLVALEETQAFKISQDDLIWFPEKFPELKEVLTAELGRHLQISHCILKKKSLIPVLRYNTLQSLIGLNLYRVPDIYLASYLKVTLQELKEIRESKDVDWRMD